jgi:4-amino-4-deoxy-L-arabinose transferase-like glycosyltransferase
MKRPTEYAILFFACMLFHVVGTWTLPLVDRDEPRFAEASREMIERGDYVVPHFNDDLRLDKPPLAYWMQVASYRIFGENDFAARFPSAVAAALLALSIFAWGNRIGGEDVGWRAAIIFTLSLQVFIHAKAAVADMWLVLFVTTAHWAGWELIQQKRTPNVERRTSNTEWVWWWTFYVSLALGFLAKGPIAWVPLLTVTCTKIFSSQIAFAKTFKFTRGILLMLAIVALWGIPALVQTRGEFSSVGLGRHVVARSIVTMEGHGAQSLAGYLLLLPFYFVTIFVSFFPWSMKLPWLARKLWRERPVAASDASDTRDASDKYLLAGIGIIFVIFTFVSTKLPHYTLPAFPLLALWLARHWQSVTGKRRGFFRAVAIATTALWLLLATVMPPLVAGSFPAYALFRQARNDLRPEMEFGGVEYAEPSLVWYFRREVKGFFTPLNEKRAVAFMEKAGPRFVVMPTSLARTVFGNRPEWKTFSTEGINIAKGKHVDLTLVLKAE